MKTREELRPNYAPFYCGALYPDLAKIFNAHGYALAVHGSLAHDMDVVAVPWEKEVSSQEQVLAQVQREFAVTVGPPSAKEHGRVAYTLSIGGDCFVDLSFFPTCDMIKPEP